MVHYSKVIQGLAMYAENEIAGKLAGSGKGWMVGVAIGIAAGSADTYARKLLDNEMLKAVGIVDGENVDIDRLHAELLKQAQKSNATIALPALGAVTFTAADVDAAYRYIMGV